MAKLNRARSRIRPSSNRVLIDQTCFGRKGGLAPISLPLFQGVHLLVGEQISLSGMVVLLRYRGSRSCPSPKIAKRCRLSEGYRLTDAWARIGFVAFDPQRHRSVAKTST